MRLLRPTLLYGKHGRLGVGRTKFFEDYVIATMVLWSNLLPAPVCVG